MTEHKIPSWLDDHCLHDLNSNRDWMNYPFLYDMKGETWIIATDGFSMVGLKTPITESHGMKTCYLTHLDNSLVTSRIDEFLEKNPRQTLNVNDLKSRLTALTNDKSCRLCNDTRQMSCEMCDGDMEVSCRDCQGHGSHPCVTCSKPDACETCEGLGVVECNICSGGKISCSCMDDTQEDVRIGEAQIKIRRLKALLKELHGPCSVDTNYSSVFFKGRDWLACLAGLSKTSEAPYHIDINDLPAV